MMYKPEHPDYDNAHRENCADWTVQGWAKRCGELATVTLADSELIQGWFDNAQSADERGWCATLYELVTRREMR